MKDKKLTLDQLNIQSFSTSHQKVKGGNYDASDQVCDSIDLCRTVQITYCYGNIQCGVFDTHWGGCDIK